MPAPLRVAEHTPPKCRARPGRRRGFPPPPDPARSAGFYAAIRSYWPELRDGALTPDYTGIRPKLFPAGGPATDFTIEGPATHGVPGLVNLFGIESPGLTASLAIAEEVLARAGIDGAAAAV